MRKIAVGAALAVGLFVLPASAVTSPSADYITRPSTQPDEAFTLGEWVKSADGFLDNFDDLINGGISGLGGGLGGLVALILGETSPVGNFLSDLSAVAQLAFRLTSYPQQFAAWYDQTLEVVAGELDPCTRTPGGATPPFIFEPGWCIGVGDYGGGGGGDSSGDGGGGGGGNDHGGGNHHGGGNNPSRQPTSIGQILNDSKGAMGLPDPLKMRSLVADSIDDPQDSGDLFNTNTEIARYYTLNVADRGLGRMVAYQTLSDEGQERLLDNLKSVQNTVGKSLQSAVEGQSLNVTQDVMKKMLEMQAQQTMITGAIASGTNLDQIHQSVQHLQLSNISRGLDRQNVMHSNGRTSASVRLLGTYSRMGLF